MKSLLLLIVFSFSLNVIAYEIPDDEVPRMNLSGEWDCSKPRTASAQILNDILLNGEVNETGKIVNPDLLSKLEMVVSSNIFEIVSGGKKVSLFLGKYKEDSSSKNIFSLVVQIPDLPNLLVFPVRENFLDSKSIAFVPGDGSMNFYDDLTCKKTNFSPRILRAVYY
jgi:hypothetical protein